MTTAQIKVVNDKDRHRAVIYSDGRHDLTAVEIEYRDLPRVADQLLEIYYDDCPLDK